jgi:hypothetical protein
LLKIASGKLLVSPDKKCIKLTEVYGFEKTKKEVQKAVVRRIA